MLEKVAREADAEKKKLQGARASHDVKTAQLESARDHVDTIRRELAAHDLASRLEKGSTCPVCHQTVGSVPHLTMPRALSDAENERTRAETELKRAESAFRAARRGPRGSMNASAHSRRSSEHSLWSWKGTKRRRNWKLHWPRSRRARLVPKSSARPYGIAASRTGRRKSGSTNSVERSHARGNGSRRSATLWQGLVRRQQSAATWEMRGLAYPNGHRKTRSEHRTLEAQASERADRASKERAARLDALSERARTLGVAIDVTRPRDAVVMEHARAEQALRRIVESIERAASSERKAREGARRRKRRRYFGEPPTGHGIRALAPRRSFPSVGIRSH